MNQYIATVIIVPLTTKARAYPTRVNLRFQGKPGYAALDQIRTVDRVRLLKRLGEVSSAAADQVGSVLVEMFARQ